MRKNKRILLVGLCLTLMPFLAACETANEFCGKLENQSHQQCAGNHSPNIPPL